MRAESMRRVSFIRNEMLSPKHDAVNALKATGIMCFIAENITCISKLAFPNEYLVIMRLVSYLTIYNKKPKVSKGLLSALFIK